ncbi:hypothetical protein VNO80_01234 [Phaseolus coccineus]|uniref:Uncharacterized protein n=1 Tax=Phaseolus coccineus TaxID=3886 RepID=A0AAN9RSJ0_PHACN
MLVRQWRELVKVALWCAGAAAFEQRHDYVGGARRCATVVVLRLPEWHVQVRDGGGAARDVASVLQSLPPIAHMREVNPPIARIFADQLLTEHLDLIGVHEFIRNRTWPSKLLIDKIDVMMKIEIEIGKTLKLLEKAYDKLMMAQLTNRKKGITFGSCKVSKEIKYADKQPILPWGPRFTKSNQNDTRINLAISIVFLRDE